MPHIISEVFSFTSQSIEQVGLTGIGILIALCHFVIYFRGIAFYAALAVIGFVIIACPIGQNPAVIVFAEFLFDDLQRVSWPTANIIEMKSQTSSVFSMSS